LNDQKKALCAAGSAAGLGGAAAVLGSCCAAPWAVGLLGAASAATLAQYHFLQPILLAAAALLVSGTFWLAYRQRPDSLTQIERFRLRALAWTSAAVLAALAVAARAIAA
jgi:hypothetical protein